MSQKTSRNIRLAVALDLAAQNIPVFPFELIGNDKKPVIKDWTNAATTDPEQIKAWFGNGSDYRIGVPTGKRSGLIMLDVDPRNGGLDWLAEHEDELRLTRRHTTLRDGGKHFVLRYCDGIPSSQSRIGHGVDLLADGKFVAWWPGEGLEVINPDVIAEVPDCVRVAAGRANGNGGDVPLEKRLPPSAHHVVELLNRMPNKLETSRGDYTVVMLSARGCQDALAESGELTPEQHDAITDAAIDWAERWEGYNGTDERAKWFDDWAQRDGKLAGWQSLQHIATTLIPSYAEEIAAEEFRQAGPVPRPKPNKFHLLTLEELWALPPPSWLISELLTENSFAELYSPQSSFKSFVAIGWAFSLATGTPWCGRPVKQCDVLYIVAEGVNGTVLRTQAWAQYRWQQECEARRLSSARDKKARNLGFRRAVKALLEQRLVGEAEGLSWVV